MLRNRRARGPSACRHYCCGGEGPARTFRAREGRDWRREALAEANRRVVRIGK